MTINPLSQDIGDIKARKCEICNIRWPIGVAAIPGYPMSIGYCGVCLQVGATHPLWIVQYQLDIDEPQNWPIPVRELYAEWYVESVTFHQGRYKLIRDVLPLLTPVPIDPEEKWD